MRTLVTIVTVALALVAVSGQQYQQPAGNYQDEYADYEAPRPAHPSPRSYPTASAPAQRPAAPAAAKQAPVAILKQINRHNEDGSYTYGFEGADGSFKIETKLPSGDVKGKYGFVDDSGKVRVVEYGANQYGFQPSGEGITVAPPTLVDETTNKEGLRNQNYQDYDYQQPAPARPVARPVQAPAPRPQQPQYKPQYERPQYEEAAPQQSPAHTQAYFAPQQAPRSHAPAGPAPPRPALFSQAAPAPLPQHQPQAAYANPAPVSYAAPRPANRELPQASYNEPAPVTQNFNQGPVQFAPAPASAPRAQQQARSQQSGGILDQLARDYALPQGGAAPLHDISFGYY